MQSRLLTTLDLEAQTATDPVKWAKATCRAASHRARQGMTDEALLAMSRVRAIFEKDYNPAIGAWLMLSEGILHFVQDRRAEAHDRTLRAYSIATAANIAAARPSCAAWMAHLSFNSLKFQEMARYLSEALSLASADDHQARGRASLVLADALHFSGDFTNARPWYESTRLHATAEGDDATLSAMLHNVAAFRVANIRIGDATGEFSAPEAKRATMEANSALGFDVRIGAASFAMLVPLLQGQLLAVEGRYADAEAILSGIDRHKLERRSLPLLLVDLGWCQVAQGRVQDGAQLATQGEALVTADTDVDDAAYIYARFSKIATCQGDQTLSMQYQVKSKSAVDQHRVIQSNLNDLVLAVAKSQEQKKGPG